MLGLSEVEKTQVPVHGWRRRLQTLSMWLGRLAFFSTGFMNVKIKGERVSKNANFFKVNNETFTIRLFSCLGGPQRGSNSCSCSSFNVF